MHFTILTSVYDGAVNLGDEGEDLDQTVDLSRQPRGSPMSVVLQGLSDADAEEIPLILSFRGSSRADSGEMLSCWEMGLPILGWTNTSRGGALLRSRSLTE